MTDPTRAGGKHPFLYQRPSDDQVARITNVREGCRALLDIIERDIKPSRERSLAITKLEEVSMWANKAIVFEGEAG